MLLGRAPHILAPDTLALMLRNRLPGNRDVYGMQPEDQRETTMAGIGFGLGLGVYLDRGTTPTAGSAYWGGAASTVFWLDPAEDLSVEFYTQYVPSVEHDVAPGLQARIYATRE
jgi:CubicO group peptidase (beta-lactamase class C family)